MPMRFGPLKYIVIHHPAMDGISDIKQLLHPPFSDIPYNYVIDYETGAQWKGRSLAKRGAHVIPNVKGWEDVNNNTAIGVALEGNYEDDKPPLDPSDVQFESAAALVGSLCAEYNIHPRNVLPHRTVTRTACPGKHLMKRWTELIGKIKWYYLQYKGDQ